jgi:adenylate cyclase
MHEERTQRRLAAILAADVVGYSRLMQVDEAGTLATLKTRRRDILQPAIARHRGRIVKVMGDGVLAEFASAVHAVECAVALQQAMEAANAGLPEDRQIVLRIGINLGDVMVEGSDLYGDGVNIAARLEGLCEAGSVLVSQTVFSHVRGKVQVSFADIGEHNLKNMPEPVRIYRITNIAPSAAVATSSRTAAAFKPSIAVLPFTNMSADPDQLYISDGITEDIITELSRYRELLVIARNSSFQYRNQSVDMKRVGRELGAEYLVEGSLRKAGNRLRITAQLIEVATGSHLWADRYDRDVADVFAVQDEVTQTIVSRLVGQLGRTGAERARRKPTESWAAYDYVLQALQCIDQYDIEKAKSLLNQAIASDPRYALAYALLSYALTTQFFEDVSWDTIRQALEYAERALSFDNSDPYCHACLGFALTYFERYELAEIHLNKAVSMNPNSVGCAGLQANLLTRIGRTSEALKIVDETALRDPIPASSYWELRSIILFQLGRYEEVLQSTSNKYPLQHWDHAYLAAAYVKLGREVEARAEAKEVLRMKPDFSILAYAKQDPFKNPADQARLLDAFRAAGLPD